MARSFYQHTTVPISTVTPCTPSRTTTSNNFTKSMLPTALLTHARQTTARDELTERPINFQALYSDLLKIEGVDEEYLNSKSSSLLVPLLQFQSEMHQKALKTPQSRILNSYDEQFPPIQVPSEKDAASKCRKSTATSQQKNSNILHSIPGVRQHERANILQLHKEYGQMDLRDITIVYYRVRDSEACRQFLKEHSNYLQQCSKEVQIEDTREEQPTLDYGTENMHQKIEQQYRSNYEDVLCKSLKQIRKFVRCVINCRQGTRSAALSTKNKKARDDLRRWASINDDQLQLYIIASRIKTLKEVFRVDPRKLNLHEYFAEQVEELLEQYTEEVIEYLRKQRWRSGDSREITVEIVTGKGLHSKNRQCVLKPLVRPLLYQMKADYKLQRIRMDFKEFQGGFRATLTLN